MKLASARATAYFARPDPTHAGVLIFGPDAMRVALRRQQLVKALVGEKGEEEMRLTRMTGAELRKDPAAVLDGMKAQGFFPGHRVVFVEEATDLITPILETALKDWQAGDASIVVTAGQLNARSKMRKLFEGGQNTVGIGIYDDPPSRDEVERELSDAGLKNIPQKVMADILALSRDLDPGDFRQTVEKLSLYKFGDDTPLSVEDLLACAPATSDAALDDAINLMAEAQANALVPMLKRLAGQGVNPTTLCISANRHFNLLYAAACDPSGPDTALSRARPPVFGPRRDRMARQARRWGKFKLERALAVLMDTDLTLRSSNPTPDMALLERAFIRIAMLCPKK
jgi:DNA polymerase-3 subunit delta